MRGYRDKVVDKHLSDVKLAFPVTYFSIGNRLTNNCVG